MLVPGSANPLLLRNPVTSYQVQRSLRFNSADSASLSRAVSTASNRKTYTLSLWAKRAGAWGTLFNAASGTTSTNLTSDTDKIVINEFNAGTPVWGADTVAVFRDYSAWYHIVLAVDTTQATAADRVKLYVNNVLQTLTVRAGYSTAYPTQNADTYINNNYTHSIGSSSNAYLANIEFVNGSQLTPSSFAETDATTGQWVPKAFSGGSYGTNGFKLTFADNSAATASTLGADSSGNGNHWSPTNLSVTAGAGNDALTDSPTSYGSGTSGGDVRGNFCTLNPLDTSSNITLSNGNLDLTSSTAGWRLSRSTIGVSSGKWYYETVITANSNPGNSPDVGIAKGNASLSNFVGSDANGWSYCTNGQKFTNNSGSAYGATFGVGDVIGCAFDADNGTLTFYKNGTSQGQAFTGLTSGPYFFAVDAYSGVSRTVNFGQRAFAYTPPANYKPLVDTYLPTPTVAKPSTVMDVKLYSGNSSTQSVTGLGFSPDFVWIKGRSNTEDHVLSDVIRGTNTFLYSNSTLAEATSYSNVFNSFDSTGFSLGYNVSFGGVNVSGRTYAAWCWDAGTSTVTNTQGSITSTVRANASAGFSIVTYTGNGLSGQTVGHGLGVAPSILIFKCRSVSNNWDFNAFGTTRMAFNTTEANSGTFLSTLTSTTFSLPSTFDIHNASAKDYVVYAWAPVTGYSSFGSYTGNGSTDGPFVYTGFRPRWIMFKRTQNADGWLILDAARNSYNVADLRIEANSSGAETDSSVINVRTDFLSNGFRLRGNWGGYNQNGETFIYCAFAESPLQYARAR